MDRQSTPHIQNIAPGHHLLHYRIIKQLGKGAMGAVFLAEDTRLKRPVALKLLLNELFEAPDAAARFRVEAEAAARLNHPAIATVYTVEESGGHLFIVMEYIPGKSLKDLIPAEGLDPPTFFKYFIPLCEALVHAHENGIIHRDIKPANIIVTRDGMPKLLDFGLARIQRDPLSDDHELTRAGTIMGSPAYMSPEQALGRPLDHRSDLFSLGTVMHEALTGKRPFRGSTFQELLTAVTRDDPEPLESLKPDPHPLLAHVLRKSLEKERNNRYQTARDILNDLRAAAMGNGARHGRAALPTPAGNRRRPMALVGLLAVLLLVAALSAWVLTNPRQEPSAGPERIFRIPLVDVDGGYAGGGAAISPDGRMIAYVRDEALKVMDLQTGEEWAIPDTKGVEQQPFWSPDSRLIGYIAEMGRYIRKTTPKGGGSALICNVPGWGFAGAATWGDEGIVFEVWGGDWTKAIGLMRVSQDGGTPEHLSGLGGPDDAIHQAPFFLPDGQSLLFVTVAADDSSELMVRGQGVTRSLLRYQDEIIQLPVYSRSGHILFQRGLVNEPSLWALPFSPATLDTKGEPFLVAAKGAWASAAGDGTLVYMEVPATHQEIVWVDRRGGVIGPIGKMPPGTQIGGVAVSPNGTLVAMDAFSKTYEDIWIMDSQRGVGTRLTFSPARDAEPVWMSETELFFTSERNGASEIFRQHLDAGATAERVVTAEAANPHWSAAAGVIAFDRVSTQTRRDLCYRPFALKTPDQDAEPVVFLQTPFDETMPQISPDGRRLAFMSNRSGRWEVMIRPFPEGEGEVQISLDGGGYPRWHPGGSELFFATHDGLMVAKVHSRPKFTTEAPQLLFPWKHLGLYLVRRYDVSPDGARFAVVRETETESPVLVIAQNWRPRESR